MSLNVDQKIMDTIRAKQAHRTNNIIPYWRKTVDSLSVGDLNIKWSPFIQEWRDGVLHPIYPTSKQLACLMLDNYSEVFFGGAAASGKVVMKGGVVLTPFGFKKIEDLKIGDRVNNPDGSVARIIQLHPWSTYQIWRVHFHDGTFTDVAEGHLWLSWKSGIRKKHEGVGVFSENAAQVIETKELKEWCDRAILQDKTGLRPNWPLIPVCQPQRFNVSLRYRSRLDPYQLGYWIGDGSSKSNISFTTEDHEHFLTEFPNINACRYGYDYRLRGDSLVFWKHELTRLKLNDKYSYEKFVPLEFKYGTIETRYAIVQGLMDTDGTVDQQGRPSFCSTSLRLAKDVKFLIESLGGTAMITKKQGAYRDKDGNKVVCRIAYNLYIKHPHASLLFRLERKKTKCEAPQTLNRKVVKVEVLNQKKEGRCITVSHPNGLYLTNDFIVTHNSTLALIQSLQYVDQSDYNAIIFRRSIAAASRANSILDRAFRWLLPQGIHWDNRLNKFTFPSGAALWFGYFDSEFDYENYKGSEFQTIIFEELDQFEEKWYEMLFDRLRKREGSTIPLRMRSNANPGGRGHGWIKKRWNIQFDGEKQIYRGFNPSRPYIPAFAWDNPHVNLDAYVESMSHVDPVRREQMLMGNWVLGEDGRFKPSWLQNTRYSTRGPMVYLAPDCKGQAYEARKGRNFITIDPAASVSEGPGVTQVYRNREPSNTAIGLWKLIGRYLLLWKVDCFSLEIPEAVDRAFKFFNDCKKEGHLAETIGCEVDGTGRGFYQLLCRTGLPVTPLYASQYGDKVMKSGDVATRMFSGTVFLPAHNEPQGASWLADYEEEVFKWTGHPGQQADRVDMTSWAGIMVTTTYADAGGLYTGAVPESIPSGFRSFR